MTRGEVGKGSKLFTEEEMKMSNEHRAGGSCCDPSIQETVGYQLRPASTTERAPGQPKLHIKSLFQKPKGRVGDIAVSRMLLAYMKPWVQTIAPNKARQGGTIL